MAATYFSMLPTAEKNRYIHKIELFSKKKFNDSLDPYQMTEWVDDLALWPPVEFGSIYSYLIDTNGDFTKDKLKAYKSLDAYNYYSR